MPTLASSAEEVDGCSSESLGSRVPSSSAMAFSAARFLASSSRICAWSTWHRMLSQA